MITILIHTCSGEAYLYKFDSYETFYKWIVLQDLCGVEHIEEITERTVNQENLKSPKNAL